MIQFALFVLFSVGFVAGLYRVNRYLRARGHGPVIDVMMRNRRPATVNVTVQHFTRIDTIHVHHARPVEPLPATYQRLR
jgi:hypothetical protein